MQTEITGDDLAAMTASMHIVRGPDGQRMRDLAIRLFAGLPRLVGMDGLSMTFEKAGKRNDVSLRYRINYRTQATIGHIRPDARHDAVSKEYARIADGLERGLRTEGTWAHPNRMDTDKPWAFESSVLLVAALREAGVDPGRYLAEIHARTAHKPYPARTRHGGPIATSRKGARQGLSNKEDGDRNDLPWDMAPHLVSLSGRDVRLHEIRIGKGAAWISGRVVHDRDDLVVRSSLPQTMRAAAVGIPIREFIDAPLLSAVDEAPTRVLREGNSTVFAITPRTTYLADPPAPISTAISRMKDGMAALDERFARDARDAAAGKTAQMALI